MKRIFTTAIAVLVFASCAYAQPYKGGIAAKHHHRLVAQVTQVSQPIAASPSETLCRPGAWRSVTPDVLDQAAELVKQYRDTSSQIAKLQAAGPSKVIVARPDKVGLWLDPKSVAYEGSWDEVRQALQVMLDKRLATLACKLQALGVTMEPPKNS